MKFSLWKRGLKCIVLILVMSLLIQPAATMEKEDEDLHNRSAVVEGDSAIQEASIFEDESSVEKQEEKVEESVTESLPEMQTEPEEIVEEEQQETEPEVELEEVEPEAEPETEPELELEPEPEAEVEADLEEKTVETALFEESPILLESSGSTDLAKYLTAVTGTGTKYDEATGDFHSSLRIDFSMSQAQLETAGGHFTYLLPEGILVPEGLLDKSFVGKDESDRDAFQYSFIKDGDRYRIDVDFYDNYQSIIGDDIHCYLQFYGGIKTELVSEEGDIKAVFKEFDTDSGEVKLIITYENTDYPDGENAYYDIHVDKKGSYLVADRTLVYQVAVSSNKGTPSFIQYEDHINLGELKVGGYTVTVTDSKGQEVPYQKLVVSEDYQNVTMTLPQIVNQKGDTPETYTVTYRYQLSNAELNKKYQVNNTVKVISEKEGTVDWKVEASASTRVDVYDQILSKKGSFNANQGSIQWTITVNKTNGNIAGGTVTDEAFSKLVPQDLTISPKTGYRIQSDANGKVEKIVFDAIEGGQNLNTYTIKYKTYPEIPWSGTVHNDVEYYPPGEEGSVGVGTDVNISGGSVDKEVIAATSDVNNKQVVMKWKSVIHLPNGGLKEGTKIQDSLWATDSVKHWMTWEQVEPLASLAGTALVSQGAPLPSLEEPNAWIGRATDFFLCYYDSSGQRVWKSYQELLKMEKHQELQYIGFYIVMGEGWDTGNEDVLTMEYQTTGDTTKVENEKLSTIQYWNKIQIDNKLKNAFYPYQKKVIKTDGRGHIGTSQVETDPETRQIFWNVQIYLEEDMDRLEVIDTLPEGVELEAISYGHQYYKTKVTISEKILKEDEYQNMGITLDGSTLTQNAQGQWIIDLKMQRLNAQAADWFARGKTVWVVLVCRLKGEDVGEFTKTNKVEVIAGENIPYGSSSQTQKITIKKEEITPTPIPSIEIINKESDWESNLSHMEYRVAINKEGRDLLNNGIPEDTSENLLTLEDTLEYDRKKDLNGYAALREVNLLPDTVKLYYAKKDENEKMVPDFDRPVDASLWKYNIREESENIEHPKWKLTVEVPDDVALVFVYYYKVEIQDWSPSTPAGAQVKLTIQNTAKLSGTVYESTSNDYEKKYEYSGTSGGVTSKKYFRLYKVDAENNSIHLSGAEFTLYKYDGKEYVDTGTKYTTDGNGQFQVKGNESFAYNTAYYMQETKAPNGYELPDAPIKYYFYFSNQELMEDEGSCLPEGFKEKKTAEIETAPIDLSQYSHTVYCQNEKEKAYRLPETGGNGTAGYRMAGILLIAVGMLLSVKKRNMQKQEGEL